MAVLPLSSDLQEAIDLLKLDVGRAGPPAKEASDQLSPWIWEVVTRVKFNDLVQLGIGAESLEVVAVTRTASVLSPN